MKMHKWYVMYAVLGAILGALAWNTLAADAPFGGMWKEALFFLMFTASGAALGIGTALARFLGTPTENQVRDALWDMWRPLDTAVAIAAQVDELSNYSGQDPARWRPQPHQVEKILRRMPDVV